MECSHVGLKKRIFMIQKARIKPRKIPLSPEAIRILPGVVQRIDGMVWGITTHAVSRARSAYEKEYKGSGQKPDPAFLMSLIFQNLRHELLSVHSPS